MASTAKHSTRRAGASLVRLRGVALAPVWLAQVLTMEKSFARNPILGSLALNERGLHAGRVRLAHRLSALRRRRLRRLLAPEDRAALDRDGFVVKRDFLSPGAFEALARQVAALRAPAREMVEGDTVTRRIALSPATLAAVPALAALAARPEWHGLIRYAGSTSAAPLAYVQTILSHAREATADPQRALHTDTFHPTAKAWLFLTDVAADAMPFTYVPGSHRLTPERLAWERAMSLAASRERGLAPSPGAALRRSLAPAMLAALGLPPPIALAVPANTLVVADTFGFHARGPSARPTMRVEIHASQRRNPFLPWAGLDPWSLGALEARKAAAYWRMLDLLATAGLGRDVWRRLEAASPFDPVS